MSRVFYHKTAAKLVIFRQLAKFIDYFSFIFCFLDLILYLCPAIFTNTNINLNTISV